MFSVALIMSDNPYAPNGAAGYMKRLYANRAIAKPYGVGEVYLCHGGVNFTNPERYVTSVTGKAKQSLKKMLLRTRWGTKVAIQKTMYKRANNAISMFNSLDAVPDVVIFNDYATHDLFSRLVPNFRGLKLQIMHNNGEFGKMLMLSMPKVDPTWVEKLENRILDDSDVIVHVGAKSRDRFCELHPDHSGKAVHIHTGIEDYGVNQTGKSGDKLIFVCVGTVCGRKNQSVLLDLARDDEINDRCSFVVVGGGPDYESCNARANELGLSEIVRFVGPSSNVLEYYRGADAFLSVSRDEGLPTAALEAMSCALPIIVTDVGSCAELVNGNGVVVPTCQPGDIAEGIKDFISKLDDGSIFGAASREMFESRYTVDAMWREYASLITRNLEAE